MSLSKLVERTRAVTTEGTAVPLFRLCFSRSVFASLGLVLAIWTGTAVAQVPKKPGE